MSPHRHVRLLAANAEGERCSLRDAVNGVYYEGRDPTGFTVEVIAEPKWPTTALSIVTTTSTPPFSDASTDTGAHHNQGELR
jgi:hypothetical protein